MRKVYENKSLAKSSIKGIHIKNMIIFEIHKIDWTYIAS